MVGRWMAWMVAAIVEMEKSCKDVLLVHFYGIFGMKGIVGCLKISSFLFILFALLCNIQPLGGVQITQVFPAF